MPLDEAVAVYVDDGARSEPETSLETYRAWMAAQNGMFDRDIAVGRDRSLDTFDLNTNVTHTNVEPGTDTLVDILKDELNGRTAERPQPFTIMSSSVEAAPAAATP